MKRPPHCPNRRCRHYHRTATDDDSWYVKRGFAYPHAHGRIQRFQCRACNCSFSTQTFSLDYGTKKRLSYRRIMGQLICASGIRDIARDLHVAPTTILNRISRLARQAIAIQATLLDRHPVTEDLVADGFESFAVSQYFPNNIHIVAGKQSQFWYATDYAHIRRKGRMSERQKQKHEQMKQLFVQGKVSVARSFTRIIERIETLARYAPLKRITLYTDEHQVYRRVIHRSALYRRDQLLHRTVSSKRVRSVHNPLFSVNYLDREQRKDLAEHCRETVQHARNVINSLERNAVYRFNHNFLKEYRINAGVYKGLTHANVAGIDQWRVRKELKTVFTRRRFLYRVPNLSFSEALVWLKGVATPLKRWAHYVPAYVWD